MIKYIATLITLMFSIVSVQGTELDSLKTENKKVIKTRAKVNYNPTLSHYFAKYHNIDVEESDNHALYDMIFRWYNTRYVFGGMSKYGTDCSGFTTILADSLFGVKLHRVAGPQLTENCTPVKKSELKTGDLVFFKIGYGYISHVGMYLENNKFVHAACIGGVIISDLNEPYYKAYFYSGGRIKNLDNTNEKNNP